MKIFVGLVFSGLLWFTLTANADEVAGPVDIFERYLVAPHPVGPSKTDAYDPQVSAYVNRARQSRLLILAELGQVPHAAVPVAERVLLERASPKQRQEIVSALGERIHTRACADLLYRVLQDVRKPEDENAALYEGLVCSSAVHGLRRMYRRTDRSGGQRRQRSPEFEPLVAGLVPYLMAAANDEAVNVRVSALYGLADSRSPEAVAELRNRLTDPSARVRLMAACFLTEYQDASGLPEMRKALVRFRIVELESRERAFSHYAQIEMLLASFERITGKRFGEIPMNPLLSSSSDGREAKRYRELLGHWEAWWNGQP